MFSSFDQEPVLETGFTSNEVEELMANLLQAGDEELVVSPNSGSEAWSNRCGGSVDGSSMDEERKRKRKLSNRESARRSRWRKKRQLEDLTAQSDRFRNENRDLMNRIGSVVNRVHSVQLQNEQLRSESVALWTRLENLHRVFKAMQESYLALARSN